MRFGIQPYSMVFLLALACESTMAQSVDYSVVSVPEESGTDFTQISQTTDYVCMPEVKRSNRGIGWFSNRILDISTDGSQIAYLSFRNNTTNIFIKDLSKQGSSIRPTVLPYWTFLIHPTVSKSCSPRLAGKPTRYSKRLPTRVSYAGKSRPATWTILRFIRQT